MSKYKYLDKLTTKDGLNHIDTYLGVKIFHCDIDDHPDVNEGFLVVSRNYVVDSGIDDIEDAKYCINHFYDFEVLS